MDKILVIDDEITILENLAFVLEMEGFKVIKASRGLDGISFFKNDKEIQVVITDMKMPGINGFEVLKEIHKISPETGVIILTGHGDMENAIQAMKLGAFDYINKPISVDKLTIAIKNAIHNKNLILQNKKLQEDLIKKNRYLQELHDQAEKILLNLVPKKLPEFDCIKTSSIYKCCDKVGGDMFDVFDIGKYICFYLFDVCSHGIVASVITLILKGFFDYLKLDIKSRYSHNFTEYVQNLNLKMLQTTSNNIFATLFVGYLNKKTLELSYISAGHIDQYCIRKNCIIPLKSTGTMLGIFKEADYELKTLDLEHGDKLLLFSDGVIESCDSSGEILGQERFFELINRYKIEDINYILTFLQKELLKWNGENFEDDITLLGIELT